MYAGQGLRTKIIINREILPCPVGYTYVLGWLASSFRS